VPRFYDELGKCAISPLMGGGGGGDDFALPVNESLLRCVIPFRTHGYSTTHYREL